MDKQEDYLAHYGVLGMKWGVHRGRAREAYARASKKKSKLEARAQKQRKRAEGRTQTADRVLASRAGWKAQRGDPKSTKRVMYYQRRAATSRRNAARLERRAKRWSASMDKVFRDVPLSDIL